MPQHVDGTKASNKEAFAAWAPLARDLLLATARTYHAFVTYKALAEHVQERSGITTNQRLDFWIGDLLELVAAEASDLGEPPITSLCVRQDGSIGDGYRMAPRAIPADPTLDPDDRAALDRLTCYRAYASDLPADGGVAAVTPQVAERRARQDGTRSSRLQEVTCPKCFLVVPAGATCSNCGNPLP